MADLETGNVDIDSDILVVWEWWYYSYENGKSNHIIENKLEKPGLFISGWEVRVLGKFMVKGISKIQT